MTVAGFLIGASIGALVVVFVNVGWGMWNLSLIGKDLKPWQRRYLEGGDAKLIRLLVLVDGSTLLVAGLIGSVMVRL